MADVSGSGAVRRQQPYRRLQGLHDLQEGGRLLPLWHMPPLGPQVISQLAQSRSRKHPMCVCVAVQQG